MDEGTWSGLLRRFDLDVDPLGIWLLQDSVEVAVSSEQAQVGWGCWRSDEAQACAEGSWQASGPTAFTASVRELDLDRLQSSLPEGWTVRGTATADAAVP